MHSDAEHRRHVGAVVERITAPNNWRFKIGADDSRLFLQVQADEVCNVTGKPMHWAGRKWLLSPHMTDGEIVQTALKACLTAAEHEIREQFKYRGVSIFDPHYDIEKLVELRGRSDSLKERTPTGG